MKKNSTKRQSGFTLLEVMIASGIMATALVMLMGSVISISNAVSMSEERALTMSYVTSVFEDLRGLSEQELLFYQAPQLGAIGAGDRIEILAYDNDGNALPLPLYVRETEDPYGGDDYYPEIDLDLPTPLHIQVTIKRLDKAGREFTVSSSTYLEVK